MEMSVHYVEECDLVVQIWRGELVLEEMIAQRKRGADVTRQHPECAVLADLRAATLTDPTLARLWVDHVAENYPGTGRIAAVAQDRIVTAMSMVFASRGKQKLERGIEVFSTLEAALGWLGRDPEVCTCGVLGVEA